MQDKTHRPGKQSDTMQELLAQITPPTDQPSTPMASRRRPGPAVARLLDELCTADEEPRPQPGQAPIPSRRAGRRRAA
jgi:hypothetical protein